MAFRTQFWHSGRQFWHSGVSFGIQGVSFGIQGPVLAFRGSVLAFRGQFWLIGPQPGVLCECRDRGGIQAIVANFEEFGESRGELGEAQGRGS